MPKEHGLAWSDSLVSTFMCLGPVERQGQEAAQEVLDQAIFIEQKFSYFLENVRDWGLSLLEISMHCRQSASGGGEAEVRQEDIDTFNRRLMNVLTTARAYTDGVTHHMSELFAPHAQQRQYVDSLWARHYDQGLGYRAMYALRNHVQHRGLPVHGISFRPYSESDGFRISIDPYLRPSLLQKEGTFKGTVLKELLAMGDTVSMKPLLRDYVKSLWAIQDEVRQRIDVRLQEWMSVRARFLATHPPVAQSRAIVYAQRDVETILVDDDPFFYDKYEYHSRMRYTFGSYENCQWTHLLFDEE